MFLEKSDVPPRGTARSEGIFWDIGPPPLKFVTKIFFMVGFDVKKVVLKYLDVGFAQFWEIYGFYVFMYKFPYNPYSEVK